MALNKTTYQRLVEAKRYGRTIDDALLRAKLQYGEKTPHLDTNLENIRKDTRSLINVLEAAMDELNLAPNV